MALLKAFFNNRLFFDAERLLFAVDGSIWRPGIIFSRRDGRSTTKKLQDYFTDAKLGRSMREHIPLLLSREHIAWIVGNGSMPDSRPPLRRPDLSSLV